MSSNGAETLRLNLGAGNRATPGWVCIDRSPNTFLSRLPVVKKALRRIGILNDAHMTPWDREIVRGDIRSLSYPDNSVDAVYSSHALEHIYLNEAKMVLAESYRVLRQGAMIRLALPDGAALARRLVENGDAETGRWYNDELRAHPQAPKRGLRALIAKAGGHIHRWQPTAPMVKEMLKEAGFTDIRECTYRTGEFPDVGVLETREESFFLEAKKA